MSFHWTVSSDQEETPYNQPGVAHLFSQKRPRPKECANVEMEEFYTENLDVSMVESIGTTDAVADPECYTVKSDQHQDYYFNQKESSKAQCEINNCSEHQFGEPLQNDVSTSDFYQIQHSSLPLAPSMNDFLMPGAAKRYRPRPEWLGLPQHDVDMTGGRCHGISASFICSDRDRCHSCTANTTAASATGSVPASAQNRNNQHVLDDISDEDGDGDVVFSLERSSDRHTLCIGAEENGDESKDDDEDFISVQGENNASKLLFYPTNDTHSSSPRPKKLFPTKFGREWDPALNFAIRENATEAACALLEAGASVDEPNVRGITPIILAAQKGNMVVTLALLDRGADLSKLSDNGSSAVLQAAHFGYVELMILLLERGGTNLIEAANSRMTTPLMRAAQEGHYSIVKVLLQRGAQVNRRNRLLMTALMLAAQRGHAQICEQLLAFGADVDARTNQNATSLHLACKRGNVEVVRVLVTAACELWTKDSRGRTARDTALRRGAKDITELLDSTVQIHLMQQKVRQTRSFEMVRIWLLLQQKRATISSFGMGYRFGIDDIDNIFQEETRLPFELTLKSTQALLRTMTLPAPLVESIAQFLPMPHLWPQRMAMLTKRALVDPNATVISAFDLIDEILEEAMFLKACDAAQVPPPASFSSWSDWKRYLRLHGRVASEYELRQQQRRLDVTVAIVPTPSDLNQPTFVELRRQVGYLGLLAHQRLPRLPHVLMAPPFFMPSALLSQLVVVSDLALITRRMLVGGGTSSGIVFESTLAMDLVMLSSRLCAWYWRGREGF